MCEPSFGMAIQGRIRNLGFLTALRDSTSEGAQALVVIAFESAALTMVREEIDSGLYDDFVFGDGAKRPSLVRSLAARPARVSRESSASMPPDADALQLIVTRVQAC